MARTLSSKWWADVTTVRQRQHATARGHKDREQLRGGKVERSLVAQGSITLLVSVCVVLCVCLSEIALACKLHVLNICCAVTIIIFKISFNYLIFNAILPSRKNGIFLIVDIFED